MSVNTKVNGQLVKSAGLYKASVPIQSGDIYSLEERQVGVYTDGKPLYQKTFEFNGTYTGTNNNLSVSLPSAETAFITNCWGINANGVSLNLPYAYPENNTNNNTIFISSDHTYLGLRVGSNQTISKLVATIQYTKTTDVAGSGEYVPSGDKAEHYSTDEEVIGTFLGETLYRKVFNLSTPLAVSSQQWATTDIPTSSLNVETLVNSVCICDSAIYPCAVSCDTNDTYVSILSVRTVTVTVKTLIVEYTKTS